MALEESPISNDTVIEKDGVAFLINDEDQEYFQDTTLDYKNTASGYGKFELQNCKYPQSDC